MEDSECTVNIRKQKLLLTLISAIPVARTLAQALSNMVTINEPLLGKLWDTYMSLPEDQVVLMYNVAFWELIHVTDL